MLVLAFASTACAEKKTKVPDLSETSLRPNAEAPIVVPAGKPIVIGLSLPLTGPDGVLGEEERDAAIVAIKRWKETNGDQIGGHEIEVRVEDDGCTEADITAQAAERLLRAEGLVGVIGPGCSAGAEAAIPIYTEGGITVISGTATQTGLTTGPSASDFFFRTAYRSDLQGALIGIFASAQLRAQLVYIMDDGEPYGLDLADKAQQAMEGSGATVRRASIERGTVDFSELAMGIAQAQPAFVGFAGFNPEAALLYRQLRDAGYTGIFGAGDAAASRLAFVEPVGAAEAEGVVFAGCSLDLPEEFTAEFNSVHGYRPDASSFIAQTVDAGTILLDAVARTAEQQQDGSLSIDPGRLRDAVRATDLEVGLSGRVAFDEHGDRVPNPGDSLADVVDTAIASGDLTVFPTLGLVACQVQTGQLVNTFP
jgi:branched-chain amino acid transport system substrate-binding protein